MMIPGPIGVVAPREEKKSSNILADVVINWN
jgi:hypothetical protein